jgi:hypothetical protein
MKSGIFVTILVLILVAPLMAQDEGIQEGVIHKQFESDNPPVSIQVASGDKTGVILNAAFVTDGSDVEEPSDLNWIKYSDIDSLYFFVNFTALFTTKVRFHLLISGPEFYSYTSQNWIDARYKTSSYWYKWGNKSEFLSKKGVYKLIIIAEQEKPYGGENCIATCTFRVY